VYSISVSNWGYAGREGIMPGRLNVTNFFKEFNWRDPVERVFGIVVVGAAITFVVLIFYDPGEILGMSRGYLLGTIFWGIVGTYLGLYVVRWFRKRDL
jgi:hypothetical protein